MVDGYLRGGEQAGEDELREQLEAAGSAGWSSRRRR